MSCDHMSSWRQLVCDVGWERGGGGWAEQRESRKRQRIWVQSSSTRRRVEVSVVPNLLSPSPPSFLPRHLSSSTHNRQPSSSAPVSSHQLFHLQNFSFFWIWTVSYLCNLVWVKLFLLVISLHLDCSKSWKACTVTTLVSWDQC